MVTPEMCAPPVTVDAFELTWMGKNLTRPVRWIYQGHQRAIEDALALQKSGASVEVRRVRVSRLTAFVDLDEEGES